MPFWYSSKVKRGYHLTTGYAMTAAVYKEFIFSLEDKSLYSWPIPYQREQEKLNSGMVGQQNYSTQKLKSSPFVPHS